VLKSLVAVALFHKRRGRTHGDLQPQTALLNASLELVCLNNFALFPTGHLAQAKLRQDADYHAAIAPEDLQAGAVADEFASEVWSVGVTVLCFAARKLLPDFYDFQQRRIKAAAFAACLHWLDQAARYSPSLLRALNWMLQPDPQKRAEAEQLQKLIDFYEADTEEEAGSRRASLRPSPILPLQPPSQGLFGPSDWGQQQAFRRAPGDAWPQVQTPDRQDVQPRSWRGPEPEFKASPLKTQSRFRPPARQEFVQPKKGKPGVVFLPEKIQTRPEHSTAAESASQSMHFSMSHPVQRAHQHADFAPRAPEEASLGSLDWHAAGWQPAMSSPQPKPGNPAAGQGAPPGSQRKGPADPRPRPQSPSCLICGCPCES
jgi:serine/threonine protein kinase